MLLLSEEGLNGLFLSPQSCVFLSPCAPAWTEFAWARLAVSHITHETQLSREGGLER